MMDFHLVLIRLKFRNAAWLRFYHGSSVNAFLAHALGHPLPRNVIPYPVESGRVSYKRGDRYHIGLTIVGERHLSIDELANRIRQAISGGPSGVPIGSKTELLEVARIDAPPLAEQCSLIRKRARLTIQFVTPLAVRQRFESGRDSVFDPTYFDAAHFLRKVLYSRLFDLKHLNHPTTVKPVFPDPPKVRVVSNDLTWMDLPAPADALGAPRYHGAVGAVTLEGDFSGWIEPLVLGQYLHVGRRTALGFGRYQIAELTDRGVQAFRPARTYLDRMCEPAEMRKAWADVCLSAGAPGTDGETIEDVREVIETRLTSLAGSLLNHQYRPGDLLGVVCPKHDGGMRALAIPNVTDRIAQRAAVNVLNPAIDRLLEDSAFAYRRGLSRQTARDALENAYRDGYRFILETDIEDFFDSVDWERLFSRLDALLPGEPLLPVIRAWVTSPVVFRARPIVRTRGLPQGTAISPLLSNLFLDVFDEQMEANGFRLVRYADDFVVACRTRADAERALEVARRLLAAIGLELNDEKTRITDFDSGFRYLGFLFLRSVIFDSPRTARRKTVDRAPGDIPANSWLAGLDARRITALTGPPSRVLRRNKHTALPVSLSGVPAYVFADGRRSVHVDGDTLSIRDDGTEIGQLPLHELSHLVCVGNVGMTVPVLMELQQEGVPVFFCGRDGEMQAQFDPREPAASLWLAQAARAENPAFRLEFARRIVVAKINNQAVYVRRLAGGAGRASHFARLRDLESGARTADSVASLRGVEGRAAAHFFEFLELILDDSWGFQRRLRRPSPDPVNAMMSYGQTLLYNHISTALTAHRLLPHIGWYHKQRGTHRALASDLQEPFRPFIDGLIVYMIRRGMVKPDDFERRQDSEYPCLMTRIFRRKFTQAVEERLRTRFRPRPDADEVSYLEFIARQCTQLRELAVRSDSEFLPLRLR